MAATEYVVESAEVARYAFDVLRAGLAPGGQIACVPVKRKADGKTVHMLVANFVADGQRFIYPFGVTLDYPTYESEYEFPADEFPGIAFAP